MYNKICETNFAALLRTGVPGVGDASPTKFREAGIIPHKTGISVVGDMSHTKFCEQGSLKFRESLYKNKGTHVPSKLREERIVPRSLLWLLITFELDQNMGKPETPKCSKDR